jgi:hypothetical protein
MSNQGTKLTQIHCMFGPCHRICWFFSNRRGVTWMLTIYNRNFPMSEMRKWPRSLNSPWHCCWKVFDHFLHYGYSFACVEQRVIAGKLIRLTQKLAVQWHLMTETFTACTCTLCPSSELKKNFWVFIHIPVCVGQMNVPHYTTSQGIACLWACLIMFLMYFHVVTWSAVYQCGPCIHVWVHFCSAHILIPSIIHECYFLKWV